MKLKRTAALLLTAMMVSSTVCAHAEILDTGVDAPNTEKTEEMIHITLASEPSALWGAPVGQTENEGNIIFAALTDRLIKIGKDGEILPSLATSWEWVDATHCKFVLRDDVTMTDGTPLTADDVVYSVGVWREYSPNTDTGRFLAGAEKVDDQTVIIETAVEAPDILSMLGWTNFGIVSEDEVNAAGGIEAVASNPVVGSGRYKFVEWKPGEKVLLERNENYWDPDYAGYFKTIELSFTTDAAAREMAVESGDSQVAADMPVSLCATYAENDKVNPVIYDYGQVCHLWYNMTEGCATADQKVRQAIEKCLDYDALANVGTGGTRGKSLGYATESSPYYNQTIDPEERKIDIEGAKALLAEAGYEDGLDLKLIGTSENIPTYTVIQENCRAAGINVTIDTPDVASFVMAAFGGDYDIVIVGETITDRNPSIFTFVTQASIDSGFVVGGPKVTTPEMDGLVAEIIKEPEMEAAKEKIAQLEQIMKENTIQTDLYPELRAAVIAKDLKGYNSFERGFIDLTSFYK